MKNHSLFVYFRIILPAIIAVLLFFFTSFYYFLPRYEQSLLAEKKNQIHEMVQIAWHMIDHLNDEVGSGFYTLDEAKDVAKSHLRNMRYGQDSKDYFWINDFVPMLIMHPYRPDLEMQDLSDYADPNGTKLFMEFISTVNKQKEGYVPYMWQWKDDPNLIVDKLSYVKVYEPWGWIIGTGIYLEDVKSEIASLSAGIFQASLVILFIVSLIACHQIYQAMKSSRLQKEAESALIEYKDQLEIKVKERTSELEKSNRRLSAEIDVRMKTQAEKEQLIEQLQESLENIKTLKGLLPICSYCKNIRDDSGYWKAIDSYFATHSDTKFSHGICPKCLKEHYPDISDDILEEIDKNDIDKKVGNK